jgi:hypothetical protein
MLSMRRKFSFSWQAGEIEGYGGSRHVLMRCQAVDVLRGQRSL